MPPPGISRSTQAFFTKGQVDSGTKDFFTQGKVAPLPKAAPAPDYSFNDFKSDLGDVGTSIEKSQNASNARTVNLIEALGNSAQKTGDAFSPFFIACAIGGVVVLFLVLKKYFFLSKDKYI